MSTNDEALNAVRYQAQQLGLKYHHKAKAETIEKMIEDHLAKPTITEPEKDEENSLDFSAEENVDPRLLTKVVPMTEEQFRKEDAKERKNTVGRLIRCRITCMNPGKKSWPGEIISVGSAKLGTFKKFVPFNTEEGYHIPQIIYDMLKERKCTIFIDSTDARGHKIKKGKLIPEFSIEVLDPLTPDQLSDLGRRQAMAAGQQ